MHVKQIRRSLIFVGLILAIFVCTINLKSSPGQRLSIGALAKLRAVELANKQLLDVTSAIASNRKQKPTVFEEDKNFHMFVHADEQNDVEFFAHISSKAGMPGKTKAGSNGLLKIDPSTTHHEIYSETSRTRKYLPIYMNGRQVFNPNIIPHPHKSGIWIVVGQHKQGSTQEVAAQHLVCEATFLDDALTCTDEPTLLSTEPSIDGQCEGTYVKYNIRQGARDARVFYGPDAPMMSYGSQSTYACLGVWLQDFRSMIGAFAHGSNKSKKFRRPAEIQHPLPSKRFEKNFFLFWDENNKPYVHHEIYPRRVFAELANDGTVGSNLAAEAAVQDAACAELYMPAAHGREEFIHQATNSLLITMCKRSDYDCRPHGGNTFIMTIFHHKTYHDYHSVYEPYVMLFQNHPPFAMHAIGRKPLWIHGRGPLNEQAAISFEGAHSAKVPLAQYGGPEHTIPANQTEMFYVTSMSWKTHGQRYHGYIDDPIFLAFGIEDSMAAIMDLKAEDLVQNLGHCGGVSP